MPNGYDRWAADIYTQEGLEKDPLHQDWKDNNSVRVAAVLQKPVDGQSPYIVPPISHVVYFTDPQNHKPWKQLYTNKYIKTTKRLSEQDPNMKHYIWTNDVNTVPAEVRALPNVEVRTFDEFQNHDLMPKITELVEKAKTDPSVYVQASDVARVVTQQKYGGVYHDLDYEIFDAAAVIKYMKLASFVGGKEEEGRFDSFMGNAFIASTPSHPVINEVARKIKRNLNLEADVPDYIRYPYNKFDSIICTTGPMALTLSYFKIQEDPSKDSSLAPMLMLPARVLFSVDYARAETEATMKSPPPQGAIGGDMFSGGWGTKAYLDPIDYPADVIEKSKMQTLYKAVQSYGLDIDQVKAAKCFSSYDIAKEALAVIKQAYNKGANEAEKKARAQVVFSLIQDLDKLYSIMGVGRYGFDAVLNYGLTIEQVKIAKCFRGESIADVALELILRAFELGGEANVKVVFELIQDINDFNLIIGVGKYGFHSVLTYGLLADQVKKAKCFSDADSGERAFNMIKQAHSQGANEPEKIANAQALFNSIQDIDNKFKMEAVAWYELNPEQVRSAKCFKVGDVGKNSIELIKEAYQGVREPGDKKARAQELFSLIQDLDDSNLIEGVGRYGFHSIINYGLPADQVKKAKCFSNGVLGETAYRMIQQAHSQEGSEDEKNAKAQTVFSLIQDLDDIRKINAVVKYGLPLEQVKNAKCFSYYSADRALMLIQQACERVDDPDKNAKSQEVFALIHDIDDPFEMDAVVKYGLKPEQVKNANCFMGFSPANKVLEIIDQAYNQDVSDKQANAQAVFALIKDLFEPNSIIGVGKYGFHAVQKYDISPEQVKNAQCFRKSNSAKKALEMIEQAYESGVGEIDPKHKAQILFSLIQSLDIAEEIERIGKYGFDAVINFGLPPEQVKNANCFSYDYKAETALKMINQAYNQGTDKNDRETKARTLLSLIEDFDIWQMEGVNEYGLPIEQVKNAICFKFEPASENALELIKQACEKVDDPDKNAKALEVFNLIKDQSSTYKMIAVVKYGLPPEHVKNAECFKRGDLGEKALKLIQQACDKVGNVSDKNAKAEEIFNLIKEQDNPIKMDAVLEYGLAPEQVKTAKCFGYYELNKLTMDMIKQAYDQGINEADKKAKAQNLFDLIQDLDNTNVIKRVVKYGFDAVVKYGLPSVQVRNAKCFSDKIGEDALDLIRQAYNQGVNEADKKANAEAVFALIQDLDDTLEIKGLEKYGLTLEQVKKAKCFSDLSTIAKSLEIIKQAYDKGATEVDKVANAQAVFGLIQDLDTSIKIEGIARCGLTLEQINNAKWFSGYTGTAAIEEIRKAFDKGVNETDKKANAQALFNKIKDLGSVYEIIIVTWYGLPPEQVMNAVCLKDSITGGYALYSLVQAYDQGSIEVEKIAKVQELFSIIRNIDSRIKMEGIVLCGLPPEQVKSAKCFSENSGEKALELIKQAYKQGSDEADKKAKAQAVFSIIKDLDNYDEMNQKILDQASRNEVVKIHTHEAESLPTSVNHIVLPPAPQATVNLVPAIAPTPAEPKPPQDQPLTNITVTPPDFVGTAMLAQAVLGIKNPQPQQAEFNMQPFSDIPPEPKKPAVNWVEAITADSLSKSASHDWSSQEAPKPNESGGDMPHLEDDRVKIHTAEPLKRPKPVKRDVLTPTSKGKGIE